ncbi:hypothetical protein PIROE2DRAFT_19301 [Piromyces sp. E2]|nr:hypothetical protein PIROE2DRAFT_19301 [Piromyces sp. E2]|eukprot:OUM56197.1 hypothetical protein PIROE2DRAFT_19301 [Piromyces sp. E2]
MSNSLAHYLRKQGIGRNDIIPIICERSYHFVVGVLGIMKSGAAYLPIDPEFPKDRIQCMIEESKSHLILYYINNKENKEKLTFNNIEIYSLHCHNYEKDTHEISNINQSSDLIYVLFTSGTTGKPKGTLITHNNIINYCLYSQTDNGKDDIYRNKLNNVLAICKFTHDISIGEINYPLLRGSKIVLCNDEEFNNPEILSGIIIKYDIDYIFTVPSRIENYMNNEEFKKSIINVNWFLLGGEKVDYKIILLLQKYTNGKVLSVYGPSETSVISNIKILDNFNNFEKDNKPIITVGKPLCNFNIYILDKYLKPVPTEVNGEIYIGGHGVGQGYLNQTQLTKEKFIDCPYHLHKSTSNKMYRTGDIGKWTKDGEIICIGRTDFQVKIHGIRIELGEIENIVEEIEGIKRVIVIDKISNVNKNKYLICYYTTIDDMNVNSKEIRIHLKNKLPLYMIPNFFIYIKEFPITQNGKLDRNALPEPNINELIKTKYSAPETEIEKIICCIYSEIFNIPYDKIGRNSDFYEIGGDSFVAFKFVSEIKKKFKLKLNIKDILSKPTVYELSEYVAKLLNDENGKMKIDIIEKRGNKEFPVTSQQLGVYIDSIKNPNSVMYNVPVFYKMDKNVNIQKIKDAIIQIFNKQEILKSKYYSKVINGKTNIYGYIDDNNCKLNFEYYNYENVNSFIRPFDLSNGPLIRVGFLKK